MCVCVWVSVWSVHVCVRVCVCVCVCDDTGLLPDVEVDFEWSS